MSVNAKRALRRRRKTRPEMYYSAEVASNGLRKTVVVDSSRAPA
jgi:hypothetical protein